MYFFPAEAIDFEPKRRDGEARTDAEREREREMKGTEREREGERGRETELA